MQHEPYIMNDVGVWFSNLKDLGSLRRTHTMQRPIFQYITLTETLNLVFRDEFDIYRNLYKISFSATLINTKENKFVSNTYVSHQATIFFKDVQNFLDEQADGTSKKKPKTFKPSQDYFHDPIWIGLFRNKKEVPDVKLAIEVAQYQFDVQTKQSYGATTLGYAIIDLKSKFKTTKLYKGSVRDALQEYYQKEQKDSSFEVGFQWMEMKASDVLLKIVGPFVLFGSQQFVPGVRDQRMPIKAQDLPLVEYDQLIDFNLDRVEIQLQKVVELDLQIFLIDKWTKHEKHEAIKAQKLKTYIQIVSHNGFGAINAKQYDNRYELEQRESTEKAFIYKTKSNDEINIDTLFIGCVVLFQLVQVYQIIANEVPNEDQLEIYIGWFAIAPETQKNQGEIDSQLQGNGAPTFNDNGYFIKFHAKTLGQAKIRYSANKNVHQISDHQDASTPDALRLKRLSLEISKQSKGDQESLKGRLQNMTAVKKLQIKTGKIRDETLMRQNKMMHELFDMKEKTQQTLASMVEADTQIQVKTQSLLNEFHELIVLGQQNFKLTKDKYNIEQKKLIEYQERKQKLDQIEVQTSVIVKTEELYQYSKMFHPNLKIIYRYNFTDFIQTIDFGSRGAFGPKKLEKLNLQPGKKFINIRILFSSYKSVLKLHSSVSQDDFILPNIYNFENLYPRDLEFRVHFLGKEYKVKATFEEYITNQDKFLNNFANIVNNALFEQLIQYIDLNEKKLVIEIWEDKSQLLIGRSFLQFNLKEQEREVLMDDIQELDVISFDSQYVVGSYICYIFIQTTNQRPKQQQQQKEVRIVEQFKEEAYYGFVNEVYVPPISYDDVIRIYISQDNDFRISFKNPFLLEPKQVILFHHCEIRGNDNLKMPYFSEDEIVITGESIHYNREIDAFIEVYTRVIVEIEKEIVIDEEDQKEVHFNTEQDLDQIKRQRTREKLKTVLSQTQLPSVINDKAIQSQTQQTHQTQQSEFQSDEIKPKEVVVQKKIVRQEIPHLTRIYKLIIMNCESLNYDAPVAQEQILFTSHISDSNQQLKGYSSNPYCVRFQDHIPLVKNTLFKIPITCKTMDNQFRQIRFTMIQGDFMKTLLGIQQISKLKVNFRPQDCIVSKLYDIQCTKGMQQTKSIVYQNRFDKVVILQFRSTYNLIRLDTQVQEFKQFEQKKISVDFFAYNMTRKVEIKVYIQDSDNNYFDCIMFKIQYL